MSPGALRTSGTAPTIDRLDSAERLLPRRPVVLVEPAQLGEHVDGTADAHRIQPYDREAERTRCDELAGLVPAPRPGSSVQAGSDREGKAHDERTHVAVAVAERDSTQH